MKKLLGVILISPAFILLGYVLYTDLYTQVLFGITIFLVSMFVMFAKGLEYLTED